ncbi:MAG TPA: gliding motility-associated C-terminal domain-containing protein [Bacteroidia bacterium]|nr:gliding motility-associated C-terminal domain-containing protein [Bacteroidia bacterium]
MKVLIKIIFSTLFALLFHFAYSGKIFGTGDFNAIHKNFSAPPVLTLDASDYNGYNISCHGDTDGSIDLTITGGLLPFDILWSGGEVTEDISNLPAGSYSVRVIDANNDTVFSNIDLIEPDPIGVTVESIANILCHGGSNGFIGIAVTGGVPSFGFLWSDASTNEDLQNVVAGNYSVIITDLNGCTQSTSRLITQPDSIQVSFSVQDETCGNANGNIISAVMGGVNPFTYLWSNAETTSTISNLQAATYILTVTDSNSCVRTDSVSLNNLPGLTVESDSVLNANCFGDANGGIFISILNGTSPYSFLWSDGSSAEDLQNVVSGIYTVTVTDINGCSSIKTDSILDPPPLTAVMSSVNSTCGNANGTTTATSSGGTSPYSYLWSDGQTTQTATGLNAATFTVTITDAHGCTFVDSEIVSDTPGPSLAMDSIHDENCFGDANGEIFISVAGGTGSMDYLWSDASTAEDLQNGAAGVYTVTVTDDNNCTATLSGTIGQPSQITASTSSVNSTCGNANGTATATPSGGISPYSYLWSNAQTTQTATGLIAGTYTVTITDVHSCTFVTSETVSNTAGPVPVVDSVHNENCFGDSNGDIFISVSGGTGTMDYLWSNASTLQDLQNVTIGTYTVTVTDDNNCTATLSASISQPSQVGASTSSVNSTCGNANGTATATPSGGTNPYSYLWSDAQTTQTATGLLTGTYTVTVTDDHGCTFVTSETVVNTPGPTIVLDSIHNELCFGDSNGDIFISLSGGTAPFNYLWSNASTNQDLQNVLFGNYTVTVTDDNSCTASLTAFISQPQLLTATTSSVNSTCGNANGTATVTPSGGTNPYSYSWSNAQTTQTATGLLAGNYSVTVTDKNGCTVSASETVAVTSGPSLTLDSVKNENCFGQSIGGIFISVSGGTAPIDYLWSNASTSQDLQNVPAGNYSVTVTDNNNCTVTLANSITEPQLLTSTASSVNSTCGNANGTATATPSGGTNPYSYLWSDAQTTQTATGLSAGNYTVTVTDDHGCTFVTSETIVNTPGPAIVLDSIHNELCFGNNNGDIFISLSGGTAPFSYLWSNASTTQDLQNVLFGNYTVTVTDDNSCTASFTAFISQPQLLTAVTSSVNSTCGNANGTATVTPSGGTNPYSYSWSNAQTTQTATGLLAGTYTVTVTDNNGCTFVTSETVSNTAGPSVALDSIHNENCFGDANGDIFISISGGTPPVNYLWSNATTAQDLQNVPFGNYTVTVTDANNCTASVNAFISQPQLLTASTLSVNSTCGNSNGTITANPSGGTNPYSYLWSNSQTVQTATGLSAGTYTVTVTDDHGCSFVTSESVTNTPGPTLILDSVVNENCFGDSNGGIFISVNSGTAPFNFLWSNSSTTEDLQNVGAGNYSVTITDANNCTATLANNVSQPPLLNASTSSVNSTCGNANGSATATPSGGTTPYSYLWSDSQTTQTATGLLAGNYSVTVTDNNGCTVNAPVTVSVASGPSLALDSVKNENCFGQSTGGIFISVSGGTAPINYLWSNGSTSQDLQNVPAGNYSVTVTDNNNCTVTQTNIITEPPLLTAATSSINSTCGNPNGTATATPSGGTGPYSYLWANGQTTQTATALAAAGYSVTVADNNGCTVNESVIVSNTAGPTLALDSIHNEKCFGQGIGGVFISFNNGTAPFGFLWSNSSTSEDLQNVPSGNYTVTITDNNNCTSTLASNISEPPLLSATTSSVNSTCGNPNGSATTTPSGGTNPYLFLWSDSQTTQTATGLPAAAYNVTVTDNNGCTVVASETVSNTAGPVATVLVKTDVSCFGFSDGSIDINTNNGTPPFSYLWSNGATTEDIANLVTGNYTITVIDFNSCVSSTGEFVDEPDSISISTNITPANGVPNGSITTIVTGGTPAYSYLWSTGATTSGINGLYPGNYTLTVTDSHSCTSNRTGVVTSSVICNVDVDSTNNISCYNANDGSVYITVTGAFAPLTYQWSNGETIEDINNLAAGTYTVTVTDFINCSTSTSATIIQPDSITLTFTPANETCTSANGSITANISGGTNPYSLLWSTSATTQSINNISAGTYTLTVSDGNGCIKTESISIINFPGPAAVVDSIHDENCFGDSNGDIFISVSSGTGTMDYLWSDASTAQDLQNVAFGIYTVTVTDDNSCTATLSAAITQPLQLGATTSSTNSTCGNANGTATATPAGGTSPYSYLWSDAQTTQTATGLSAATYTVTVTDSHNCSFTTSVTVSNTGGPVVAQDSIHDENCFGDSNGDIFISVAGGTGTIDYLWSNASTIQDLQNVIAGTYTVTVTDDNNCTASLSANIAEPLLLSATASSINSTCGNANGSANANPSGGTSPYSYLWSNSQTTQTATGLSAATYTVTVTDAHGCTFVISEVVSDAAGPVLAQDSIHDENCFGDANGDIFISVTGGTGTMDYLWSNASTIEDLQNVIVGTYTVTVTDDNNCTATLSAVITQPMQLGATTSSTNSTCGNANGSATANPTGGISPYSYLWSNAQTTQTATGLSAATYTVTVTDNHGCTFVISETVSNSTGPVLALDSIHNENCFGDSNGDIFISVSGGATPLNYLWSDGSTNQDLINVSANTYTVTVTDANSCVASISGTVTEPLLLTATTSSVNSTCGNANGTITATPSGGTSPYSYLWSNSQTTQTATGLLAAAYTVTVTDAHGCTFVTSETVSDAAGPVLAQDSIHNENCFGDANGDIFISVTGGTGTMDYLWSNASTIEDLQNVIVGTYTVTVTDDNSCTATLSAVITQPLQLGATTSSTNSTCGNANGSAIANPTGGISPYSYLWSNAQTTQTATGLAAATYTVTVTDINSCSASSNEIVNDTPGPSLSATSVDNADCFGNSDGSIDLTVNNGTAPFSYLWSNAETIEDISNLSQGNYTVTVTDFNSCTASTVISISQPDSFSVSVNMTPSGGAANGALALTVSGGTLPYSYLWSTGASTDSIGGLTAGLYNFTITDSNLCTSNRSAIVTTGLLCDVIIDSVLPPSCYNGNDGAIYISVSGMVPPITYQWSNGETTEDITNLAAGTYTVTVSDLILCTVDTSIVVTQPDTITVNFNKTNEACNSANGSITANPTGGTGPYTYVWSTAATTQTINNLSAGIYTVTITDNNSCTKIQSSSIINVSGPALVLDSVVDVKCFGDSSGAIFIDVTGGAPPFDYLWSDASTSQDLINEIAGTYTVVVIDTNSCTDTLSATINQPSQLNDSITTTSTTCGSSTGNATVWPYGGVGPYTYLWSNGFTTQTITNLIAGPYTVTVTDANNCTVSSTALVNNIGGPVIALDSIFHVRCNGESNGGIFISPSGGTPGYTYFWSNGTTTQDNPNIPAGIYFLIVQDANNCIGTFTDTVFEPAVLNDSIVKINEICGQTNGVATVYGYGGTSPYQYQWSNGETTQTIDTLQAGTYTVTITDNHLCTKVSTVTILNLPPPSINIDSVTDAKCFGDNNGAIYISVNGSAQPFTYLWTGGSTTEDIIGITSGTYTVTVTDANLCTASASAFVDQPDSITIATITTPSVCGGANGTATANASGGLFPYSYLWSTGATTQVIVLLAPGIYTVTVTDANGCKDSALAVVPSTGGATITLDSIVDVKCFGQNNGAIYISVTGTPTLTYTWIPNGAITQDNINIPAGTYIVLVFDGALCLSSDTFQVEQPDILDDSIVAVNETCGYGNGTLTVYPFGGTPGYSFQWSPNANSQTTQTADSLSAGTYTVTVTDLNGCTENSSATISNTPGPSLTDSVVNVKCFGDSSGAIYITVSSGTPPFDFLWSNSATTQNIINVIAGNYSVIVTDSNSCADTLFATVTEPAVLDGSISVTNETCGGGNGVLTANPFGGTFPYSFLWSTGDTIASTDSLSAGIYTVTITDFNGCTKILSDTVINIPGFTINLDSLIHVTCFGDSTGAIYVSPNGGTFPYTYLWSNSQTTDSIVGIPEGTYTVSITDANNCKDSATYIITQPNQLLDSISIVNANCGLSDGSLTANPYGGTGPYTFLWSTNADTTQTIDSLSANTYTVTVTDANGCTVTSSATISDSPGPLIAVDSIINVKCNGENTGAIYISVSSGTSPFSYIWSTGATDTTASIINLFAGTYTVTVTDANNCSTVDSMVVTQPPALTDSVQVTNASCNTSNGSATVYPYGGTGPYSIHWSTGETTFTVTGLAAGTYTDTITDGNGCVFIGFVNVSNIGGPVLALDSIRNISCNGACDGAVFVTPTGVSPFQYNWSNGATTQNNVNICAATYTLTVSDSANCIVIDTFSVTEPDSLLLSITTTDASCNTSDGSATVTPSGGTLPYTYVWSNSFTTQTISLLPAGTYTVTVTDGHGCQADTIAVVINPDGPQITGVVITNVNCFGELTGVIDITVSNGTLPYDFLWSNFQQDTTEDLTNVGAGLYTVTITDDANCTTSQTYEITQPPDIQISFTSIINPSCDSSNGSITAIVTGGTGIGTYTYLWSNSATTSTISGLPAGSYTLTVIDDNGCRDSSIASLSNITAPTIIVDDSGMVSCYGVSDGFITVSVTGGNPPYTYYWINTTQTGLHISNLPGNTYTLYLKDADSCLAVRTVEVTEPLPISIPANVPLQNGIYNIKCHGGNDGSIYILPSGGTPAYTYLWSNATTSQNLLNIPAGSYSVTVTDAHGCTKDSAYILTEPPQLISDAGSDQVICGESTDTLQGNVPSYGTGNWIVVAGNAIISDPGSPITAVSNLTPGINNTFQWIVRDDSCSVSSQVIIRANTAITAIPGADRNVCSDSIVLTAVPPQFGSGFWTILSGGSVLIDSAVAQTSVISLSPGINQFLWTVMNGTCTDSAVVTITLRDPEDCLAAIQMPTGITPNGDGKNDGFVVHGLDDYFENTIIIYNRWGNKVFEQSPYLNNWQGTNQTGGLLPEGTYFVILKIKSITKVFTGYIDLRR